VLLKKSVDIVGAVGEGGVEEISRSERAMGKKDEKQDSKPKAVSVRDPKGGLPRKKRKPPTSGTRTNEQGYPERYAPGKRLKSAHRRAKSKVPLRAFAAGRVEQADWFANKRSSGR